MLPSETMIWQPEFTDKTLSRKTGAVQPDTAYSPGLMLQSSLLQFSFSKLPELLQKRVYFSIRHTAHNRLCL
ncbi:hypothetical protein E3173_17470 [Escherichia coli O157:H7]|nr:hypothetical protein E3173_17470 [Escherichia coli O157:H7]